MTEIRAVVVVLAVGSLFAIPTPLEARSPRFQSSGAPAIELSLDPVLTFPRSGAPIPLTATLTSRRNDRLVRGVLEVTLLEDGVARATLRTPLLTLAFGSRTIQLLVPGGHRLGSLELHARFVGEAGVVQFPPRSLQGASANASMSLLVVTDRGARSKFADFARTLALERTMDPELRLWFRTFTGNRGLHTPVWTTQTLLRPEQLPDRPLALTVADVVLVDSQAFRALSPDQLDALLTWTRAGGSLCVLPAPGLPPGHRRFLRDLVAPWITGRLYEEGADGQLTDGPGLNHAGMLLTEAGLGHFALVMPETVILEEGDPEGANTAKTILGPPLETGVDSREGRRLIAFLWKLTPRSTENLEHRGRWPSRVAGRYSPSVVGLLAPSNQVKDWELLDLLSSRRARPIPVWVIASILLGLVILTGPADYIILKRLRRRSWTWITFPAICVAATVLTAGLARSYLGAEDDRSSLIVVDLDDEGRIVRENRIELFMSGVEQVIRSEGEDALVTRLFDDRSLHVEGRYPGSYTIESHLAQWDPVYRRTLSFTPGEAARNAWPEVDRERVDWSALRNLRTDRPRTRSRADEPRSVFDHPPAKAAIRRALMAGEPPTLLVLDPPDLQHLRYDAENSVPRKLIQALSFEDVGEHPAVIERRSPDGGPFLDDLRGASAGTEGVFLIAVTARYGGDIVLYRWFGKGG